MADLRKVGGRKYAAHPTTKVLCAVALLPDGTWVEWRDGDPEPEMLLESVRAGNAVAAHNAGGFDRHIWSGLGWPEARWIDTQLLARAAGLPGSLDKIGETLFGRGKDVEGRKVTLALSRVDRRTGKLPRLTKNKLDTVVRYCRRDVELLAEVWPLIAGLATDCVEDDVREVHQIIVDRGFVFDVELARGVIGLSDLVVREARSQSPASQSTLNSQKQLRLWLQKAGHDVDNVRQETLLRVLDDPDVGADVRAVLRARLVGSRAGSKKLRSALPRVSDDGRMRDTLAYHAAHTGRWGGRGIQPQNLPRGVYLGSSLPDALQAALSGDLESLRTVAKEVGASLEDVLATLVRPCITAPSGQLLIVSDYSQIEARGLLWLVEDDDGLDVFRRYDAGEGVDAYRVIASLLFGVPPEDVTKDQRRLGKALVLGCGYGMGAMRFEEYASQMGVDWSSVPMSPEDCVDAWRDDNELIAGTWTGNRFNGIKCRTGGLWKDCEQAAMESVELGHETWVGRCAWNMEGQDLVCRLPSQRVLRYREALIEDDMTPWGDVRPALTYIHPSMGLVSTFGGKLVENLVQAVCRDLLADALVRAERADLRVVLHVHDEIVCEVETTETQTARAKLEEIMTTPPQWAAGFPIAVESQVLARYAK